MALTAGATDASGWTGFYGPGYRALLATASAGPDDDAWARIVDAHRRAPQGEEHWEFLACGYLHLFDRENALTSRHAARLSSIAARFQQRPTTANWRLMALTARCRLDGVRLTAAALARAGIVAQPDGHLPDVPGERSTQYHAYMLLLVIRFGDARDAATRLLVEAGLRWLAAEDGRHGDPSATGRGRFQLFGYASMAAAAALAHEWAVPVDPGWEARVHARLDPEQPCGALARAWSGPYRADLLLGYNTADDYAAFSELWTRGLVERRRNAAISTPAPMSESTRAMWRHLLGTQGAEAGRGAIYAESDGPVLYVAPNSAPHQSRKRRTLAALRLAFAPDAHDAPVERMADRGPVGEHAGFVLSRDASGLVMRASAACLQRDGELRSPWVWSPVGREVEARQDGCVEIERATWRTDPHCEWHGVRIRIVRSGLVETRWRTPR
jgi:hypothetical protein